MQLESFLSHQRSLEEGQKTSNGHTLFGMMKIPTGKHIRPMLDTVHPSHLQGPFDQAVAKPRAHGGMRAFERLDGRALIAIEGTGYFRSYKPGCLHCLTRKRSNGKVESCGFMPAAAIVAPSHNMAVPLMPVPGRDPIGAKISGSFFGNLVVGEARGDVFAALARCVADGRCAI
jgi:hypothetical protein